MHFLGIDPGMKGGLAWVDAEGELIRVEPMPIAAREVNGGLLRSLLKTHELKWACVEVQNTMPGQGTTSALRNGKNWGRLLGCLDGLAIRTVQVRPQKWKRDLGLRRDKGQAVAQAATMFPAYAHAFSGPRGGLLDGPAEAALIAYWCWLQHGRNTRERIAS